MQWKRFVEKRCRLLFRNMPLLGYSLLLLSCVKKNEKLTSTQKSVSVNAPVTVDVGANLEQILEKKIIRGTCQKYNALLDEQGNILPQFKNAFETKKLEILCGKEIFFEPPMDTALAVPESLLLGIQETWPHIAGKGLAKLGFIPDPEDERFPVGMPTGKPLNELWDKPGLLPLGKTRVYACAVCHFGRLPDGRFAVGAPNQVMRINELNLLTSFPFWASDKDKLNPKSWPQKLISYYQNLITEMNLLTTARVMFDGSRVVGWTGFTDKFQKMLLLPRLTFEELESALIEKPGMVNGFALLASGNKIARQTVPQIWNISAHPGEHAKQNSAVLTNFLPADNLEHFIGAAYIMLTITDQYSQNKYINPLAAYLRTLKAPTSQTAKLSGRQLHEGRQAFDRHCVQCHAGKTGESAQWVPLESIKAPRNLLSPMVVGFKPGHWFSQRTFDYLVKWEGGIESLPKEQKGLKVRRLSGVWARERLMSNGAIEGLDHLLCLGRSRSSEGSETPETEQIHADVCEKPSLEERKALRVYLENFSERP